MLICSAEMVTSTPCGTTTGIFPTRDIVCLSLRLGDVAEHFAADTGLTCLAVGHHTLGGGDDRHTQAIHDLRDVVAALVDAQAGTAHALDTLDHRATGVVLQRNFQLGASGFTAH